MTGKSYVENMADFSRFLRTQGLPCNLKETEEACLMLSEADVSDREETKKLLQAVYAKSREEQEIFSRCFDRYFISEERKEQLKKQEEAEAEAYEKSRREAEEELMYQGKPMAFSPEYREIYIKMPEEEKEKLRQFRKRFKDNEDRNEQLYGSFIHSVFMRSILEQQMIMEDAAAQAEAFDSPDLQLLYRSFSQYSEYDIPKAAALIDEITRQMNRDIKRRQRTYGTSGRLDFKRTIRKGLETGGMMYRLKYKKRSLKKRRYVLFLDVSASMLQFSEFALKFISSLAQVSEFSRTFIFSEHMRELDHISTRDSGFLKEQVKKTGLSGKGTNLADSLAELLSVSPPVLGTDAVLIILSDAKTVDQDRALALLQAASRKSSELLWLNPIPEHKWHLVNSITRTSAVCTMLPCGTLEELRHACLHMFRGK